MDGHFSQLAVAFFRKTEKQDAANEDCGEDQKNRGIPADHVACIQKSPGNPVHFHSHLVKYLLKYRQDFYQKDQDHNSHHAKHEQRISDCRPYLSGDFFFLFIVGTETFHDLIQAAGFLAGPDIGGHGGGKDPGFLKSPGKRTVFFHGTDQGGENLPVCIGLAFVTEDVKSFRCGYAGMQKHSHLPAEAG